MKKTKAFLAALLVMVFSANVFGVFAEGLHSDEVKAKLEAAKAQRQALVEQAQTEEDWDAASELNDKIQALNEEIARLETEYAESLNAEEAAAKEKEEADKKAAEEAAAKKAAEEAARIAAEKDQDKAGALLTEEVKEKTAAVEESSAQIKEMEKELQALIEQQDYVDYEEGVALNEKIQNLKAKLEESKKGHEELVKGLEEAKKAAEEHANREVDYVAAVQAMAGSQKDKLAELINKQNTTEDYDARVKLNAEIQKQKIVIETLEKLGNEAKNFEEAAEKADKELAEMNAKLVKLIDMQNKVEDYEAREALNTEIQTLKADIAAVEANRENLKKQIKDVYDAALALLNDEATTEVTQPSDVVVTEPTDSSVVVETTVVENTVVDPTSDQSAVDTATTQTAAENNAGSNLPKTGETTGMNLVALLAVMGAAMIVLKKKVASK